MFALLCLISGCSKHYPDQPVPNQAPDTHLFLVPDSTLRRTTSQQHIHWWGVDPDGFVIGYLVSVDSVHWSFTTRNDSVFSFRINTIDTTYSFFVSAVDNHGNGRWDASTPWGPEPFTDVNGNNVYDPGEPYVDFGNVDPTPASLKFPIENSPPNVSFLVGTNVPDTTYPVATFQWQGTDLDGNGTILNYYYALDDTLTANAWKQLPGTFSSVTLFRNRVITADDPPTFRIDSLTEGNHVFYLKARDIAGAYSRTVRMPDSGKVWYVRIPKGDFLIVDDDGTNDFAPSFYKSMFDTLMGGRLGGKDVFDIKKGSTAIQRGEFVPALINPTFIETIKLFKYIYWYSDNSPSLTIAQSSLPDFKKAGGKVVFSSGFPENVSGQGSLVDFAPISDVEPSTFFPILQASDSIMADSGSTYPTLKRDNLTTAYAFPRGLLPKVDARILYVMGPHPPLWTDRHVMGVKDADQPSFILFAIQLHRFGTPPDPVAQVLRRVYQSELGVK